MTPCSPRYLPCAGFLFNFRLTVFLIFSLLLSWRLEKQKSIHCGRRSRSLWITRPEFGLAACSAALSRRPLEYHQRPRGGHRFRSRAQTEKQGIYSLCTKMRNKFHRAPREPGIFSLHFFSFWRIVLASILLSHHTSLLTPFGWYTSPESVIMLTLQIWAQNISTPRSVIIR